jgi:hypothetical protein
MQGLTAVTIVRTAYPKPGLMRKSEVHSGGKKPARPNKTPGTKVPGVFACQNGNDASGD